jgi:hypothetical protein
MTMDDKEAYSSKIAAEAVGERPGSPPPDAGEQAPRPDATSAGPQARVADKTAESVGERVGDAYADATTDEAQERSRKVGRHAATQAGSQTGGGVLSHHQFDQQTFLTVVAAFALGYLAALLIHHRAQ